MVATLLRTPIGHSWTVWNGQLGTPSSSDSTESTSPIRAESARPRTRPPFTLTSSRTMDGGARRETPTWPEQAGARLWRAQQRCRNARLAAYCRLMGSAVMVIVIREFREESASTLDCSFIASDHIIVGVERNFQTVPLRAEPICTLSSTGLS